MALIDETDAPGWDAAAHFAPIPCKRAGGPFRHRRRDPSDPKAIQEAEGIVHA